jgi:hypothetical protein
MKSRHVRRELVALCVDARNISLCVCTFCSVAGFRRAVNILRRALEEGEELGMTFLVFRRHCNEERASQKV